MRERGEAYKGFRCGNLRERDHSRYTGVEEMIMLIWIFRKWNGVMDWI
jgi:hypothetical protein